jgi:hypothetical protein
MVFGGVTRFELKYYRPVTWVLPGGKMASDQLPVYDGSGDDVVYDRAIILEWIDEPLKRFVDSYVRFNSCPQYPPSAFGPPQDPRCANR